MGFQTAVQNNIGFGVVGELFLEGPLRAQPARLASATPANNIIGRAFTIASGGDATGNFDTTADPKALAVQAGAPSGTPVFAGILANPKVYSGLGTLAGGSLAPTLVLPNNTMVELVEETAGIIVDLPAAAAIGDWVYFTNATGALVTTAPGASAPGASTRIPNARVVRYGIAAAGLAVISLDAKL